MEYINESLLNRGTMNGIYGAVIHNDAGSMTPKQCVAWLKTRDLRKGIAHYYGNRNQMARVIDTNKVAWHTANDEGNGHYMGYEICESLSASDADFRLNEEAVLKQVAEDFLFYGIPTNRNTVRLHKEFSSTTCPHRSWALHGQEVNAVKDYFIERIKFYMTGAPVQLPTTAATIVAPTPEPVVVPVPDVTFSGQAHIQNKGWVEMENNVLGTVGESLRLEAFSLVVKNKGIVQPMDGVIHVQDIGDVGYQSGANLFGTVGQEKRLEAVKINVGNGVQYRAHIENLGWSVWVRSGEWVGTTGKSLRIEAIEFRIA